MMRRVLQRLPAARRSFATASATPVRAAPARYSHFLLPRVRCAARIARAAAQSARARDDVVTTCVADGGVVCAAVASAARLRVRSAGACHQWTGAAFAPTLVHRGARGVHERGRDDV
jgi:hypothetical protein